MLPLHDYYGINANIVHNEPDAEIKLEFDESLGLTPTSRVADFTLFGFLKDNCID